VLFGESCGPASPSPLNCNSTVVDPGVGEGLEGAASTLPTPGLPGRLTPGTGIASVPEFTIIFEEFEINAEYIAYAEHFGSPSCPDPPCKPDPPR